MGRGLRPLLNKKQLPPINKDTASHLLDHPHIFLDEVMRQAQDNEIIRLSMDIREGKSLSNFMGKDVRVLSRPQFEPGMLLWGNITLCGTNKLRRQINETTRSLLGYTEPIVESEKLINLKNNWDLISDQGTAFTNGVIGNLENWCEDTWYYNLAFPSHPPRVPVICGRFKSEIEEDFGEIFIDKKCLIEGTPFFSDKQKYVVNKSVKKGEYPLPHELTYGYCLTVHKSQGSEWEKVLILEEEFPFNKEEHKRFLYTAVTRASSKAILIMK